MREPTTIRPSRAFVAVVAARFCFLLGVYVLGRFMSLFIADSLGLGADAAAAGAGTVLAILALVTVAASVPAGWLVDRVGRGTMLLAGGIVAAVGIAAVPAIGSVGGMIAVGVLVAIGSAAFASASWTMLADLAPRAEAGWLLGVANVGTAGAAALAGAFGILVDSAGFGPAFVAAAAFTVAGGIVGWVSAVRGAAARLPAPAAEAV